jgi:acyl dehydratase
MGAALGAVVGWIGDPGAIRSQRARFTRPVLVPDTDEGTSIEVSGVVIRADDDSATIKLDVIHNGQSVLGRVEIVVDNQAPGEGETA